MKKQRSFKLTTTSYQSTWYSIPEDLNLQIQAFGKKYKEHCQRQSLRLFFKISYLCHAYSVHWLKHMWHIRHFRRLIFTPMYRKIGRKMWKIKEKKLFTPVTKVRLSPRRFSFNLQLYDKYFWVSSVPVFLKFEEKYRKDTEILIYAPKITTSFTSPIFTKRIIAWQYYVQLFSTGFPPNWSRNMEITSRSVSPSHCHKVDLHDLQSQDNFYKDFL